MKWWWRLALLVAGGWPFLGGELAEARQCFVALDAFLASNQSAPTAPLENLLKQIALKVLEEGDRTEHASITFGRNQLKIKTRVGDYSLRLTRDEDEVSPKLGLPEVHLIRGRIKSEIVVHESFFAMDPERTIGALRSALRADPYLNPHLRPPGATGKPILSYPQREALAALLAMENRVKGVKGLTRGLVMPVGMGKSVVAARYVTALSEYQRQQQNRQWQKKPKVLFVVENRLILDHAVETFNDELDFKKVSRVYGENANEPIAADSEMVAITRSSYNARIAEINKLMVAEPDQPWVVVFDEAQHLGKEDGQFDAILADMHARIDSRHRVLLLSATLWHPDKALIVDYLQGNIHGSFLDAEEQGMLSRGEHLAELCRLQFFRGVNLGYLSPIRGLNLVRSVGGHRVDDLLGTDEYTETKGGRVRVLKRYRDLLKDVDKRIKANRTEGIADRGVIYVDTIARANAYAAELAELTGEEVRAYHSGSGLPPDTFDWFNDRGDFATPANRRKHKYLVCVDILREGVDVPAINVIVLLRRYGDDMGGFRNLIQNIGRGSRHFAMERFYKLHLTLIDYSLYSRWLRDGLAQISVEPSDPRRNRLRRPGYLVVDNEVTDPITFRNSYFNLFPRDGSFAHEFPFFDREQFQAEGLRFLHEISASYGIDQYGTHFGAKRTVERLASFLAPSPEKDQLIADLDNDALWGWKDNDGVESKLADTAGPAFERIFRALYRIAALLKLEPRGKPVDLFKLYQGGELRKMVAILDPERIRSLQSKAERQAYTDKETGAWALINAEAMARNTGKVSDPFGLRKLMQSLGQDLKEPADRDGYLKRVSEGGDLDLNKDDGIRLNATAYLAEQRELGDNLVRVRGSLQRSYRAFYALAQEAKKMPGGETINLDKLYERSEAEKVLKLLNPKRVTIIFDEAIKHVFLDEEKGAVWFLAERSAQLGSPSFARDFAPMRILAKLAEGLDRGKPSKAREATKADLLDVAKWGWVAKDGANITTEHYENPTRRFFLAILRLAEAYNRLHPERPVDLTKIHERDEIEKLYDYLTIGTWAPAPLNDVRTFASTTVPTVEEKARDYKIVAYGEDFGPKRLALEALARLKKRYPRVVTPEHLAWLSSDQAWAWKKADGQMLRAHTSPRTDYRSFKAFSLIAVLYEQGSGKKHAVETPSGFSSLFDELDQE